MEILSDNKSSEKLVDGEFIGLWKISKKMLPYILKFCICGKKRN